MEYGIRTCGTRAARSPLARRRKTTHTSAHGVAVARGRLQNRLNTLIDRPGPHSSRRFATHLAVEFPAYGNGGTTERQAPLFLGIDRVVGHYGIR